MDIDNQYLEVLNHLQTGIVVHGADTQVLFCNPRAGELLGLSEQQMLGKTAKDTAWRFVDESGRTMPVSDYPVNRVISSGDAIKGMVLGRHTSVDAPMVWLLVSAFPQKNAEGQLTRVVVDFHDITERKKAQELQAAQEAFSMAVFDSLSEHIAVLDREANIVAVNHAWRQFGQRNDAPPEALSPIGINYLGVCSVRCDGGSPRRG